MAPLKVYLCDLTHDSIVLVSDTIPINVGFIAAYAKKQFGDDVDLSLFKYPRTALEAIRDTPPDVIALSNYSWNSNLSEYVASRAKQVNPSVVTVQGGTNFPHALDQQGRFLAQRPATDFHTVLEGETAFANILKRVLEARENQTGIFDTPVEGTVFIKPSTRGSLQPEVLSALQPDRIRQLDDIPSPYLTGILDVFFDGRLTPFLETNRGCPFKCSFCHTGADYFQKINMFSIERVCDEIDYIAPRAAERGITNLHVADTNFGMYPRDRNICQALYRSREEHGWPQQIIGTTGKNNKERVIDITGILGNMFSVNMSVQSMDKSVLANINRSNIKLEHYMAVNRHLEEVGRSTKAELILGLPGESRESFIRGLEQVLEAGGSSTTIYTLMLLHGTQFQDPAYRKKFGIKGKYRIVPLNFGDYDGNRVFDYEEVCIETNTMSFNDYVSLRSFTLLVESLVNGRPFDEFFRYALQIGVKRTQLLWRIYENLSNSPPALREIHEDFIAETEEELWDSEEDLIAHYRKEENYRRLARGEVGGNLIYKFKARNLVKGSADWIKFITRELKAIVSEKENSGAAISQMEYEIDCLADFCNHKIAGLFDVNADISPVARKYPYDIHRWLIGGTGKPLSDFACHPEIEYSFYYNADQVRMRKDLFTRYGTDVNALSKIVTRISNLESHFRRIQTSDGESREFRDPDSDEFVRYALTN